MNPLHTALLKIRFLQGQRLLREMGPFFPFLTGGLALATLFVLQPFFNQGEYVWYANGFLLLQIAWLHLQRRDLEFVRRHIPQSRFQLFIEYFVLSLPLNLLALFSTHWYLFPINSIGIYLITYIKPLATPRNSLKWLSRIIPASCFEWRSGVRRHYLQLGFCYALALSFCWVKILPLILLWICNGILSSFYQECESLPVLRAECKNNKSFLLRKLTRNCRLLLLLFCPVLLLNAIFQPELIWVIGFFIPLQLALLCFSILLKYSVYEPGSLNSPNSFLLGLVTLCCIVPFLLPIPLLLCLRTYASAREHLKNYLYD